MPLYNAASPWVRPHQPPHNHRGELIRLFHGCTTDDLNRIAPPDPRTNRRQGRLDVAAARVNTDFGRGFYTTTVERQARQWAWNRFYDPMFTRTTMCHDLSQLWSLSFALGHYDDDDYWSLVQHCRQSRPADPSANPPSAEVVHDHGGPRMFNGNQWYDLVHGPVAAYWNQRAKMADTDQISFHTLAGQGMLNALIDAHDPAKFDWFPVT